MGLLTSAVEVLVWWCLLVGVWVTTLSAVATSEMAAATGSALLCAVAATAARRAVGGRWRVRPGWAGWFVRLPVVVLVDAARVVAVAAGQLLHPGRDPGRLRRVRIGPDASAATAAGRLAVATLAVTLTPGTYVVDVDGDDGILLVHSIVEGGPSMEDVVSA